MPYIKGRIDINILLGFIFGVVFIFLILGFSIGFPNPTPIQIKSFITVLALAAAGIGGVIPGFIEIKYRAAIRAGGALSLFVIVFFFQPTLERGVVSITPPPTPADPAALAFIEAADKGNIESAWDQLDAAAKGVVVVDINQMQQIFETFRKPLGPALKREMVGSAGAQSPANFPYGLYRTLRYRTKFENSASCRPEEITLRATQDLTWRVFDYIIGLSAIEC